MRYTNTPGGDYPNWSYPIPFERVGADTGGRRECVRTYCPAIVNISKRRRYIPEVPILKFLSTRFRPVGFWHDEVCADCRVLCHIEIQPERIFILQRRLR